MLRMSLGSAQQVGNDIILMNPLLHRQVGIAVPLVKGDKIREAQRSEFKGLIH